MARLFLEINASQWTRSLATLEAIGNTETALSGFERGTFVQISIRSIAEFRSHLRAAREMSNDQLSQLRALHNILWEDLKCVTPCSCCNHSFTLQLHHIVLGEVYGQLLLKSTSHLQREARAKAIAKGLQDIDLDNMGSIAYLVCDEMPNLIGKDAAKKYLPPRYAHWLSH